MLCFVEGVDDDEQTASSSFLRSSSQCWLFDGQKRLEEQFIKEPLDTNGVASPDARSDRLEPLLEDSLDVCAELFGTQHPDTLSALLLLAQLTSAKGRLLRAKRLFRTALQTSRALYGDEGACARPPTVARCRALA